MLTILPKVDRASSEDLNRAANAVAAVAGRDLQGVVEAQIRGYVSKARTFTPIAPRQVTRNVIVQVRNGVQVVFPARKPYKVRVKGRGFARSGWALAAKKAKVRGQDFVTGKAEGYGYGVWRDVKSADTRATDVGNKIPYIEDLDQRAQIQAKAMTGAYIAARRIIERVVAKDVSRAWRTGVAIARAK